MKATATVRFLALLSALALPALTSAQTAPGSPNTPATTVGPGSPSTPATTVGPAGSSTSLVVPATRFSDLSKAPSAVATPVQSATSIADAIRAGVATTASTTVPLTTAVTQANTAIIREGQAVRSEALASRQATLTRLRLAQSESERQKLLEDLRLQSGERLDEQREVARLVRDRLRQVRDNAQLSRPVTPTP